MYQFLEDTFQKHAAEIIQDPTFNADHISKDALERLLPDKYGTQHASP